MKSIKSASLDSFDAFNVDVEATFTKGMPSFTIVGLVSGSILESRDRIKSCLLTNKYKFPALKITINLSPSNLKKSGSHFDLVIALLVSLYDKDVDFSSFYIFSELGLDGQTKDTDAIFSLVLSLYKKKLIKKVLVSSASAEKISLIPNINIYCVNTFQEACDFFIEKDYEKYRYKNKTFNYDFLKIYDKKYYYEKIYKEDYKEVLGQEFALRAALIAACGNHNILFQGSAGVGKSMIAKRLKYIMPPMSEEEILEKANLLSFCNEDIDFTPKRVLRSPHHTSTKASIFGGGGSVAKIGEIAISNNGVLFFDELPHFAKTTLEAMREPLEDYKILISRVNSKTKYTTKFLFVSAMNPCPCGNLLSNIKECRCSDMEIKRYQNKVSDPLLDRIDMYVQMSDTIKSSSSIYTSIFMHEEVIRVFIIQKNRKQNNLNGKISDKELKNICILTHECNNILIKAISTYSLSHRSKNNILKISRTIADLNNNEIIQKNDLLEALSYRLKKT